jgi:hypothetical protein
MPGSHGVTYIGTTVWLVDADGHDLPAAYLSKISASAAVATCPDEGDVCDFDGPYLCDIVKYDMLAVINCRGLHYGISAARVTINVSTDTTPPGECLEGRLPFTLHISGVKMKSESTELVVGNDMDKEAPMFTLDDTPWWTADAQIDLGEFPWVETDAVVIAGELPPPIGGVLNLSAKSSDDGLLLSQDGSVPGHDLSATSDGGPIKIYLRRGPGDKPGAYTTTRTATLTCP